MCSKILNGSLILYFLLLVSSCEFTHCSASNKLFIDKYKKQLQLIISEQTGNPPNKKIGDDDYRYALIYLSVISKHVANAEYSSTLGYRDAHKYKSDVHTWKKWLKHNGCSITISEADSLVNEHVK